MSTLITGSIGASKSLLAVEIIEKTLKETFMFNGEELHRKVYSNIAGLLLEHQPINADDLNHWKSWAKPGDVIVYDEVQLVWPMQKGIAEKTPQAIIDIDMSRHDGVEFYFITQHSMKIHGYLRRTLPRHLHVRRVGSLPLAVIYEFDHVSALATFSNKMSMKMWWHPKRLYKMYDSAVVHFKRKSKFSPAIGLALIPLIAGAAYAPTFMENYKNKQNIQSSVTTVKGDPLGLAKKTEPLQPIQAAGQVQTYTPVYPLTDLAKLPKEFRPTGCIVKKNDCQCYDDDGAKIEVELKQCIMATTEIKLIKTSKAQSATTLAPMLNEVKKDSIPQAQNDKTIDINFPVRPVEQRYDKQAIGQNFLPVPALVNSGGVLGRGS